MSIASTARVSESASVHESVSIWDRTVVRENAAIGENTSLGIGVYVGPEVCIGANCKIQNGAQIYEPGSLGNGVFVGPNVVLTNDRYPRAITSQGIFKQSTDWSPVGVEIKEGASIGAGAICVAPLTIGSWALVAAGSVVTTDVPDFALFAGVPARFIGWVGKFGAKLKMIDIGSYQCPETGARYVLDSKTNIMKQLDD